MPHPAARPLLAALIATAALTVPATAAAPVTTELRADGIGPLTLGMDRAAAVRTGWLVGRGKGCPLDSTPQVTYRFGAKAPDRLRGGVSFTGGKLDYVNATRGVRTASGLTIGLRTASALQRLRAAGLTAKATHVSTFGGTFIQATKAGKPVLGAFAGDRRRTVEELDVPAVRTCE